jgi:hypothetical protein
MCPHTYYYICVLSLVAFFTLFSLGSSLNIGDRGCASLTLVGIERDTDVIVCVCVCVCACVCVCTHFLCVSRRLLCLCHLPLFPRYEVYFCPRLAMFLAVIYTHTVFLYRYICAATRRC